jgi:alpha-1,3-rhamnosyl/mannosyltransferase
VSERVIRVALDATAIGRGKTGNETYLAGLLEGWKEAKPEGVEMCPVFSGPSRIWTQRPASLQARKAGFFKRHLVELPKARRELKADLYHGVYWVQPWEKEPFVVTVHDLSFLENPDWYPSGQAWFYNQLIRQAARKARKVITVSEFCRAEIAERWDIPADRIETTYEAARSLFKPGKKKRSGPPTILFVSAIHPRKNLGRLIRVWERLRSNRFPDLRLKVVGPAGWSAGSDLRALKSAVAKGGAEWLGSQTDEELKEAYQTATMLVYPSLYEGFGLPPLEAMACGCPVVCSKTASLPEVCGEAAEYFDPTSEEEISAKISYLLGSEERREELSRAGIAKAGEYSWERMAEETSTIYRRALEE